MVIENIYTAQETRAIADLVANPPAGAIAYDRPNDLMTRLVVNTLVEEIRLNPVKVQYVPGQPYDSADHMRNMVAYTGILQISTDFNNDPLMPGQTNLWFRAAHDLHHIRETSCNFVLDGEICAYTKFAAYALQLGEPNATWLNRILFQEIVTQTCYLRHYGEFPTGPVWDTDAYDLYIDKALTAYGL